jgi:hypothetical protein
MADEKAPEPDELERESRILELRRAGATWQNIADRVGYASPSGAWQAYQRIANRFIRPKLEDLRDMELDRLDRLQMGVWPKALNGDIRALDAVLRIIDRRARLLGLEAPKEVNLKAEVTTYDRDSIDAEVARLVALLDGGSPRELAEAESTTGTDTVTGQ